MALFFDGGWFDGALARRGLTRADLARHLGLDDEAMAEIWKDQRELTGHDVTLMAKALAVEPAEVATRAGVSTPVPGPDDAQSLRRDILRLEAELAHLKSRLEAFLNRRDD